MRKSIVRAMDMSLTPGDFSVLVNSTLLAKWNVPDAEDELKEIVKETVVYGIRKLEQKQAEAEPYPLLMED